MAGFVVECLVRWPIGCLMASCPKYSTTCSPSLPAADKLLLLLVASDFGKTLFLPANMTSLILQTAFHQSPINPAIFLWWWALWTVFEVFVWFDLFSSAKNQRQQRPASTKLRTTTSHDKNLQVVGARCTDLLTRQLCPTTSRGLPGARSVPNLEVRPLQLGRRPLLVRWLAGGWARLASATRALLQPHPPSHPPFVIHSVWHLVFPRTWNQGLSHIAETRNIKKSKKHSFQSVM